MTCSRALSMNPADEAIQNDLGVVYLEQNKLQDAERAFRRAIALDPLGSVSRYNLGIALARLGRGDEARSAVKKVDQTTAPAKISPLADWTSEQVAEYTRKHSVPMHPLYAKGYASIGCAPCTRAIGPQEYERDGRWWWERSDKECGIHFNPSPETQNEFDVLVTEILTNHA